MNLSQHDLLTQIREIYKIAVFQKDISGARECSKKLKDYLRFGDLQEISRKDEAEIMDLINRINYVSETIF